MTRTVELERISFLVPGTYPPGDPARGLEDTLRLIAAGEALGFDGAWIRQRHLEHSISSATVMLAAASQRTRTIALGTAVIQMGYENPFRLAEDLATADLLSGGRLQVGLSAAPPEHARLLGNRFRDGDEGDGGDQSYSRLERLVGNLRGELIGSDETFISSAAGRMRPAIRPVAPGLTERLWLSAGSTRSVEWAARNGFNLLIGNINLAGDTSGFVATQRDHVARFRALSDATIAVGRVILPLNGADGRTRERYRAFAAERHGRTLSPQGERRVQFAADLVGSADEIVLHLLTEPVVAATRELRLELPYNFAYEDYVQILTDFARQVAPFLGWAPGRQAAGARPLPANVTPLRRGL
ncbi:LLM class flavin-dependent oxidoreductase [Phreatobacter sp. AB_2022a]|uniref:LLM class flavin-dependent oxidoreductase n=1 Tax=Phreatobacter sp. AB_2022a TaxID=3003134 RepID=UPI0022871E7C|nr:LLM class flavin-dependent oxidoreductase [Phreatobacter sp. AB_2022a]MCZ0737841.1 LLM class flavin-dependent oxidoreductase [Phreatobacter sp. AB_2022a]